MFFTVLQSQNVGSGGVLGSGAITVAGPTLVASGAHVAPVLGSGGITIGGPTVAGSGNHAAPAHTGTGAVAIWTVCSAIIRLCSFSSHTWKSRRSRRRAMAFGFLA